MNHKWSDLIDQFKTIISFRNPGPNQRSSQYAKMLLNFAVVRALLDLTELSLSSIVPPRMISFTDLQNFNKVCPKVDMKMY